ncbi:unnamed protein product, partial [Adineta ricciae]
CFYGTRCQFNSRGFGLSLDAILGYHIQPSLNISSQPFIVQFSLILTMIMMIIGLINGILSLLTFNTKEIHQIGCGIYLKSSSISTILTAILFTLKFWILFLTQIRNRNRIFLKFQCITMDFFVQISLNINQWLNACVAVERAIMTINGTSFNQKKSKQIAKYLTMFVIFLNIITTIHDPIYRRVIDDDDDDDETKKRIWCTVLYPSSVQKFNTIMNLFHFLVPFFINFMSASIIMILIARQKKSVNTKEGFYEQLKKEFLQHRHLIITSIVLVILAIPRLIFSFVFGCMKSISEPWLFLIGYFISFIPSMLTFIVFVLPSTTYKQHFKKICDRYKNNIQRRLCGQN